MLAAAVDANRKRPRPRCQVCKGPLGFGGGRLKSKSSGEEDGDGVREARSIFCGAAPGAMY